MDRSVYFEFEKEQTRKFIIKLIIYTILTVVITYILYQLWIEYRRVIDENKILQQRSTVKPDDQSNIAVNINKNTERPLIDIWKEYDYKTMYDPLVAPRRRDDYNTPIIPIPTRGYPASFKKVGLLVDKTADNDDKYKILLLIGRNKYLNSNVFEYYASDKASNGIKFDLSNTRELLTDDTVTISELNKTYTVTMDKLLSYEYY